MKKTLNCRGKLLDSSVPRVMGILNVTPDSFFDGGKYTEESAILQRAEQILSEGAEFIDIGGVSTRPGAETVSVEEELKRVIPVVRMISSRFPEALISVDTYRGMVAEAAVAEGAAIINDISGGGFDPDMFSTMGKLGVPYVLMHISGTPQTMQVDPRYDSLLIDVARYFSEKLNQLQRHGVADIILDPGFGFGKTIEHNYTLLKYLRVFQRAFELPVLAGISRKSMVNRVVQSKPEESLAGTLAATGIALQNGASVIRAHDVRETLQAIKLYTYYQTIP